MADARPRRPAPAARPECPPDLSEFTPAVRAIGEKYGYDAAHAEQVAKLSQGLFVGLQRLHGLDPAWAVLLGHAALLHDIGYFVQARRHHRHSRYLILQDGLLHPYPEPWRRCLALIAGNHRKRPRPAPRDWPRSRARSAQALAALLRVADGLDYSHDSSARLAKIQMTGGRVQLRVAGLPLRPDSRTLERKARLFAQVFAVPVVFSASA